MMQKRQHVSESRENARLIMRLTDVYSDCFWCEHMRNLFSRILLLLTAFISAEGKNSCRFQDGVSIDRKNAPKVIAERWRTKAHRKIADTNSYEEKNSDERYESSIDDEDDESLTWKKKTARKRLGSRKKYGWRSMSGRERSRDVDYAEDELAESSEENLEGETKHKKKRPSGRTKGSRGRKRGKNPSGKSFTIAPVSRIWCSLFKLV